MDTTTSNVSGNDDTGNAPTAKPGANSENVAMDTLDPPPPSAGSSSTNSKTLKRCLSVPIIRTMPGKLTPMTTRAAAAAAAAAKEHEQTPKKQQPVQHESSSGLNVAAAPIDYFGKNIHIRSQPSSREVSPAPMFNIFTPRTRRYSASYSPMTTTAGANGATLCLTPRVSQLRQEECADLNSREVNHEREVHREIQISQSWEDLTLVAENWSCKSEDFSNPLQVTLPTGTTSCSSPSPTNNRAGMRLPSYSPSPTRRTFSTRRSMSPIMRPSQLGPVKRKFELDDNPGASNWSVYSPPPLKKIFTESRGSSPVCQSPSSVCPSPDSGTYDGRITPKLFISKLCTSNTNNSNGSSNNNHSNSSGCPSPISASPSGSCVGAGLPLVLDGMSSLSGASSTSSSSGGNSEPMCIVSNSQSLDEGISIPESEPNSCRSRTSSILSTASSSGGLGPQVLVNDLADDATLMDDAKSETSSIGGCSTISIESSSCDSGAKAAANFLNRLVVDDGTVSPLAQKSFYINKQGLSGAKKYIVNHENLVLAAGSSTELPNSNTGGKGNATKLGGSLKIEQKL
ncbi:rho GTPase-activating protein gacF [Scaptodrosophila lebanonensis]|uniref:Rho GTPase-activating protein gacF n=1 Tax=Drosophila lebanonensis TaxID=7225 RepID=A0A6J2U644_DROLE|nr:rho GTPase-activating protein gacF [Scaptodrosophila lebanonensis]XP_030383800.1 rho GTPase-activating protein gacF [Scaptodrosophila lebanonensis]